MRKKLYSLCICLAVVLVLSTLSFDISALAGEKSLEKSDILCITEDAANGNDTIYLYKNRGVDKKIFDSKEDEENKEEKKIKNIDTKMFESTELNGSNVWMDYTLLTRADIKDKMEEALDNNSKLVITKDDIKFSDVYKLFGLEAEEIKKEYNDDMKSVAVIVEKIDDEYLFSRINVEEGFDNNKIRNSLISSTYSDFARSSFEQKKKEKALLSLNTSYASVLEWDPVDSTSETEYYDEGSVSYTLSLQKHPSNPTNGDYYTLIKAITEVTPEADELCAFRESVIKLDADSYISSVTSDAVLESYSPAPTGSTGSTLLTLSYPWGVSVQYDPGSRTRVIKSDGNIGEDEIELTMYPTNLLGRINSYDTERYTVIAEMKQSNNPVFGNLGLDVTFATPFGNEYHYVGCGIMGDGD